MSNQPFDAGRAMLRGADMFERFAIAGSGVPLGEARLSPRTELLVLARGAERRALLLREMAYHHLAQGELGGEPAMVSFCVICNTGVGMTPVVDGAVHHFSAGGLYDGLVLLIDDETGTYWTTSPAPRFTGRSKAPGSRPGGSSCRRWQPRQRRTQGCGCGARTATRYSPG